MTALVDNLNMLVSSLEQLFPSLHNRRVQLAKTDAVGLLRSAEIEGLSQALEALRLAAASIDKEFDVAAASYSRAYCNINITGKAILTTGDYYSEGWAKSGGLMAKGGNHSYDGLRISDESNVDVGNVYGGKSAMEIRRT